MEATELRIGNIIRPNNPIYSHEIVVSINDNWVNNMPADNFTGIPLTEEWRLKFGIGNSIYIKNSCIAIRNNHVELFAGDYVDGTGLIINIKYVHQLQNLYFCLTGEELLLKSSDSQTT